MEDTEIIALYFARDQRAVAETSLRYGGFLLRLAGNILRIPADAEECVNDTYLHAWNAIPPERPAVFQSWLGRIARNLSLDRWKRSQAQKRGGREPEILLGELEDCIPSPHGVERHLEDQAAADIISSFLRQLPEEQRIMFLRRYWYGDSLGDVAKRLGRSEGQVKSALFRVRKALRVCLEKEGVLL